MAQPADAPIPTDDPRDGDLQTQVDDIRLALQDWRRTRELSQTTEERLAQITLQCARMVEAWQQVEQRRTGDVASLDGRRGEWGVVAGRLQPATGERIRALERAIEQEWNALPKDRHDPARQLSEQAASLAESCVTAANLALRGFASAEARLAALEQDIQGRMEQVSRDLQTVLAELRSTRAPSLPAAPSAFPLESVMRIHEELRESDGASSSAPDALKPASQPALPQETGPSTALTARVESLERAVDTVSEAAAHPRSGWRPLYTIAALLVFLAGLSVFGLWMQRRVDARLNDAALRVSDAERQRDAATAAVRDEAERKVAQAQQAAARAQIVGNVLAAPDLVRYWLIGAGGSDSRAYAQIMFSRSRGIVFSASRLEPAGAGKTYQLWLLTRGQPVSAGLFTPDSAGRVTLATDVPLSVPGRLMGAIVTVESAGGGNAPSAERVLVRVE